MAIYADLHMHTSCSDGLDSPQALLERASGRGISVVSITDHDTFKAYEQANKVAEDLGIELITGIEVSTFYKGGSVHLLGYFVDGDSAAAKKLVESNHAGRLERMEKILAHLDRLGYQVDMDELLVFAGEGTLGRVSLARFMVQKKFFRTTEEVFQKVLGDGKSAYEAVDRLSPQAAIELVAQAGGISSLAHPGKNLEEADLDAFVEAGLDAVEAYTPYHKDNETKKWLELAVSRHMAVTGGSDCHGSLWRNHDVGAAGIDIGMMEELKARAKLATCGETGAGGICNEAT